MRMHGIGRAYGPTGGYSANTKKAGSDSYAKSAAKQTDRMAGGANKVYQVYLQTDDMLYSGGNGTNMERNLNRRYILIKSTQIMQQL